ncbi:MAG: DUF6175 family protein [Tannerella sp.]|jgi:hypothetical protein|nr:DUF6175 family protein [Tannerella sp.]
MKRFILLTALAGACMQVFGQAKKPVLMVVPGENWCYRNGYMKTYDNMGEESMYPDYESALLKDKDLKFVIAAINNSMIDRGFPLKDLEATLRSLKNSAARNALTASKTTGSKIAESPLDQLKRTAKADIIFELDWQVTVDGFQQTIRYNLQGLDAYTNKQIAGEDGLGTFSTAPVAVLLKEAVDSHAENFTKRLEMHFADLFENGREVSVELLRFDDGSDIDFETEYDGYELSEIIDKWMAENTVQHRFSKTDGSENFLLFEQVRIPLYQENEAAMDTEHFVRELRRFLGGEPYKISSKIEPVGLGKCILIIGEK